MEIGTFLLNIGFFFNFIALAFREILWIRVLLTMGYLLRFFTQYLYESNINSSIWMIVFVIINLIQIIQILNERRKRHIEPKIVDLFETLRDFLESRDRFHYEIGGAQVDLICRDSNRHILIPRRWFDGS